MDFPASAQLRLDRDQTCARSRDGLFPSETETPALNLESPRPPVLPAEKTDSEQYLPNLSGCRRPEKTDILLIFAPYYRFRAVVLYCTVSILPRALPALVKTRSSAALRDSPFMFRAD